MSSLGINKPNPSPAERRLATELGKTYRKLRAMKANKNALRKLSKTDNLDELLSNVVSPTLLTVLQADIRNSGRQPSGYRWTLDEKLTALAIFKRGARAYRFLSKFMHLPSVRTLQRILQKVPGKPGINHRAIQLLKREASKMDPRDLVCFLTFDEVALEPGLFFNPSTGSIDGFVDLGMGRRTSQIADHAFNLQVQGLRRHYKQPFGHVFTHGAIKQLDLCRLLVEAIGALQSTGLIVLASVCDQGSTFVPALKRLIALTGERDNSFKVNGQTIIVIFDVPHLGKCLRTNCIAAIFMEWPLSEKDKKRYPAGATHKSLRWSHVYKAWQYDKRFFFRMSRLTKNHVHPKGMAKMKTKYAFQALSRRTGNSLKICGTHKEAKYYVPGAAETGEVIFFFYSHKIQESQRLD